MLGLSFWIYTLGGVVMFEEIKFDRERQLIIIEEKLKNHKSDFYDVEDFVNYARENEQEGLDDIIEDFVDMYAKKIKTCDEAVIFLQKYDKYLNTGLYALEKNGFIRISEIKTICCIANAACGYLAKEELKELLKDL